MISPVSVRWIFRIVAIAEAFSWIGLLTGMYLKHISGTTDYGVQLFGPIHGYVFVAYVIMCFVAWRTFKWSPKVLIVGLLASIPPLTTVVFDILAERRGLMSADRAKPRTDSTIN